MASITSNVDIDKNIITTTTDTDSGIKESKVNGTEKEQTSTDISTQVMINALGDDELVRRIKASHVLLVGAGGIGCEVIKALLLSGFERITIVDLDTIDVSNLNRQFLYNKSHVGKSKAVVAAEVAVQRFAHRDAHGKPLSVVEPIHGSILSPCYGKQWFRQFTFVINALDNNATRAHVNRVCLAADVPLVESASARYLGNCKVVKPGVTRCLECDPQVKDEHTYASCTIRNTPSKPIHCIVWAKHLFAQLFGESDEDISPNLADPALEQTEENDKNEENFIKAKVQSTREFVENNNYDPEQLFEKIFYKDILYLRTMENLWKDRKAPRELRYEKVKTDQYQFDDMEKQESNSSTTDNGEEMNNPVIRDQKLWSMSQCLQVFCESLAKLRNRLHSEKVLVWDKDDDEIVNFVAAVSNFRSYCFHIARKCKFEVKSLAGNIIPAIASTNAIVSGFIIIQALNLLNSMLPERIFNKTFDEIGEIICNATEAELQEEKDRLMSTGFYAYVTNMNQKHFSKVYIEKLLPPKPNCFACSSEMKTIHVGLPLRTTKLGDLITKLVMKKLQCVAPDLTVTGTNQMFWAAEDEETLQNVDIRDRPLTYYSFMTDGVCLILQDLEQNFKVYLVLHDIAVEPEENEGELFKIFNEQQLLELRTNLDKESTEVRQVSKTKRAKVTVDNGVTVLEQWYRPSL